jgi:hypothetical protein
MGGRYSNTKAEGAVRQMYETMVGMFELSQMIMGNIDQQSFGVGGGGGFGGGPGGPGGPGASSAAKWDPPTPGALRSPGVRLGPGGGSGGGGPAGFDDSDSEEESMLTRQR